MDVAINQVNEIEDFLHLEKEKDVFVFELENDNSLNEVKNYIQSIDFSAIIDKMVRYQGWRRKHVEKVCEMYRNYLFLCKKYSHQYSLPPSEEIDEFWHNHILDTQKYHQDCIAIFGKYYHHYPYLGIDQKTNLNDLNNFFKVTRELYEKEIGEPLMNYNILGFRGILIRLLEDLDDYIAKFCQIFSKRRGTMKIQKGDSC